MDDLVSPLRVVSALDPALDLTRMPLDVYYETRDPSLVIEHVGMAPRWFVLQPLTAFEAATVDTLASEPIRYMQAFRLACAAIENFASPGVALEPQHRQPRPNGTERLVWSDAAIDRVADDLGLEVIYEMGVLALQRRRLGKWGRGAVRFTPPLFLGSVLDQARRLRAEHAARTAGTRSSDRSAPAPATTTRESSDAPTAAPAASGDASPAESG